MLVNNKHYITIWVDKDNPKVIKTIDQTVLPHRFKIISFKKCDEIVNAIKSMEVRGAPLIGVAASYGMYLAVINYKNKKQQDFDKYISKKANELKNSRPTAVNLFYAVDNSLEAIQRQKSIEKKILAALNYANKFTYSLQCRVACLH